MMEQPFQEKAIPMVTVDQKSGKYQLTNEAIKFFSAIKGPIAVVSVAGLYRTGKSYLLNRVLLGRSNGFGVGPTVQPCTKGLWCWGQPLKGTSNDGQNVTIVVVDSEGIGALDEDQTHDTKIFTLAILASSVFIYNSVGSIDQNAIQNLSLVVNLTKHIQLKGEADEEGADPDEVSTYFPTFYWVVRDFSLQLQDTEGNSITSKEYLERALAPANGFSDDIEEKNRIRRLLSAFFKQRDCYTMVRPLVDEEKLQNLDKMELEELRPEFATQALNFRKRLTDGIKPKCLEDRKLDGGMYLSMMTSYVDAINDGAVPNIENAWNYMCQEQCKKAHDDCFQLFVQEVKELFGGENFPTGEEIFNRCATEAREKALESFREKALGDYSGPMLKELRRHIDHQIEQMRMENIKESEKKLKSYAKKEIETNISQKLAKEYTEDFGQFVKEIERQGTIFEQQGPKLHGYQVVYAQAFLKIATQGGNFIFKNLKKMLSNKQKLFAEKEERMEKRIQTLTEEKEQLRKQFHQHQKETDNKIAGLESKLEATSSNLEMARTTRIEEEKKMQRDFGSKYGELQGRIRQMEQQIESLKGQLNDKGIQLMMKSEEWEKQKAITEGELKRQIALVEEMTKKEKSQDMTLTRKEQEMSERVRETTLRLENEKNSLKGKLEEVIERAEDLEAELKTTQDKYDSLAANHEASKRKMKDQISKKKTELSERDLKIQDMEKNHTLDMEEQKNAMMGEFQTKENQFRENFRKTKEQLDRLKEEKKEAEKALGIAKSGIEFKEQEILNLQNKLQKKEEDYERNMRNMEEALNQQNKSNFDQILNDRKKQYQNDIAILEETHQQQIKKMEAELKTLSEELEKSENMFRDEQKRMEMKFTELQHENGDLRSMMEKATEQTRRDHEQEVDSMKRRQRQLKRKLEQVEMEFEEEKERNLQQIQQKNIATEETLAQIRLQYDVKYEKLQKKSIHDKEAAERRLQERTEQLEARYYNMEVELSQEITQWQERYQNQMETNKQNVARMQQELSIANNQMKTQEKINEELKEEVRKKQQETAAKFDKMTTEHKTQKDRLEGKVQELMNNYNKKEKQVMNLNHENQQIATSLERKQSRLQIAERELEEIRQKAAQDRSRLQALVTELEKQKMSLGAKLEKETVTNRQRIQFLEEDNRKLQLSKTAQHQEHQALLIALKEQKEKEGKELAEKLNSEKQVIEHKYKEQKNIAKELEAQFKRQNDELGRENLSLNQRLSNMQIRSQDLEVKYKEEMDKMTRDMLLNREEMKRVEQRRTQDVKELKERLEQKQNQLTDIRAKIDKDTAIYEQKIYHMTELAKNTQREYEKEINKFNSVLERQNSETSEARNKWREGLTEKEREIESRWQQKLRSMQENHMTNKKELQTRLKDRESELKELNRKFQEESLKKANQEAVYEKKMLQMNTSINNLQSQYQKIKKQKDEVVGTVMEEMTKKEQKLKLKSKEWEKKANEANARAHDKMVKSELELTFARSQIEELKDRISRCEEENQRGKEQREKMKITSNMERSKRQFRSKGHSFITGMKTQYKPAAKTSKLESSQPPEDNKENNPNENMDEGNMVQ